MSKLKCICGHVIIDQTGNISYKATFIRDQDLDKYVNYTDDIASFIEAVKNGWRDKWIENYFSKDYPTDINDSSIVSDIILRHDMIYQSEIYQCDNCGRVQIQVQDQNLFASFKPEDDRYKNIFARFRQEVTTDGR